MTAAIAVIVALVAGQSIGAALGALTLTQAIQLGAFGAEVGVAGIQDIVKLSKQQPRVLRGGASGHADRIAHVPQTRLCLHGAPSAQAWSICHETH